MARVPAAAMTLAPAALDALFRPRSIAFVGASERTNAPATRGLRHCLRLGYRGTLHPVNPRHAELFGVACRPSIAAIGGPVDLAMIALPAEATIDAVAQCRDAGVRALVICSSGWEESGPDGVARAARLKAIVDGSSMAVIGPNCVGLGNARARLALAFNSSFESVRFVRPGHVGLVTQSGAMLGGLVLNGEDAGADLAAFVHVGNGMQVSLEAIAGALVEDVEIHALALMIEGLEDGPGFIATARRARVLGKPVVVYKAGRSAIGERAVRSHTGALAGADAVFDAVCRDEGIIRVDEPEDLVPTASALVRWRDKPPLRRGTTLIFTLSGGAASILADECERAGITIPPLAPETLARERALLPAFTVADNPFDVGGGVFSDADLPQKALAAALPDAAIESVLWVGVGAPRDERSRFLLDAALAEITRAGKPGVIVPTSGHAAEPGFSPAHAAGVPVARSLRAALTMLGAAHRVATAGAIARAEPSGEADVSATPATGPLHEAAAKKIVAEIGVPIPRHVIAPSVDAAVAAAQTIGFPVVLKAMVAGVLHKSEHGFVKVGLRTAGEVRDAAAAMMARIAADDFQGFLLEERAGPGIETVVGTRRDPLFGPVLMFGLGGIGVELFRDVAFARCPLSPDAAQALIGRTRAATLLGGFRGAPAHDEKALVAALVAVSRFAAARADALDTIEINPLLVLPGAGGVVALDAVITQASGGP